LSRVVAQMRSEIAIVAVPPEAAQEVAERVVAAGVRAILNFAPVVLRVPAGVKVNHVDLKTEIEGLAFFLRAEARGALGPIRRAPIPMRASTEHGPHPARAPSRDGPMHQPRSGPSGAAAGGALRRASR